MVDDKLKSADASDPHAPAAPDKRFIETDEHRRIVLGKLRTDEEARLAAEIEKLRD
jgi:hypothetical protein